MQISTVLIKVYVLSLVQSDDLSTVKVSKEFQDVVSLAESLKPKGHTLDTTEVTSSQIKKYLHWGGGDCEYPIIAILDE